ncbi:MAG: hypothetical protein ACFFHV_19940 [Promethearchaeota archaeon]
MKAYKVMVFRIDVTGSSSLQGFESILNNMALDGWILNDWKFRGKDHLLVIMERDT